MDAGMVAVKRCRKSQQFSSSKKTNRLWQWNERAMTRVLELVA